MSELWLCSNCSTVGTLNEQGRCQACLSDAVMSHAALPVEPTEVKPKRKSRKSKAVKELEKMFSLTEKGRDETYK